MTQATNTAVPAVPTVADSPVDAVADNNLASLEANASKAKQAAKQADADLAAAKLDAAIKAVPAIANAMSIPTEAAAAIALLPQWSEAYGSYARNWLNMLDPSRTRRGTDKGIAAPHKGQRKVGSIRGCLQDIADSIDTGASNDQRESIIRSNLERTEAKVKSLTFDADAADAAAKLPINAHRADELKDRAKTFRTDARKLEVRHADNAAKFRSLSGDDVRSFKSMVDAITATRCSIVYGVRFRATKSGTLQGDVIRSARSVAELLNDAIGEKCRTTFSHVTGH